MPVTISGDSGITTPDLTDTSLTSGRVVYAGASGNLTGVSTFVFDGTNLGVGTSSPTAVNGRVSTLQVGSNASGGSSELVLGHQGDGFSLFTAGGSGAGEFYIAQGTNQLATFGLTGAIGIKFQPTQSASSDANTLDDYEEGTFTPTLTGSGGGAGTYTARDGIYVKVGKMVTVNFWIYSNTKNTLSGNITLTGLPFASSSTASFSGYRPSPAMRTTALTSVTGTVGGWVSSSSTAINLQINNNGGSTDLTATNLPTVLFEIGGSLSYITD